MGMMFRAGRLSFSEVGRPFWSLVALAVLLLSWVSIGLAQSPSRLLVDGLRRDLAALHLQLEPTGRASNEPGRPTAAFNTDIGDGGPVFRHASLVTIGRAAGRRLDRLTTALEEAGDRARAVRAAGLRLEMVDLQRRIETLGAAIDPVTARARAEETQQLIVALDQQLANLLASRSPN
jgi:hypothetical protein